MRMIKCLVRLNKLHVQPLAVPPWEILLLRHIHGGNEVEELEPTFADREYPDPINEFDRLALRYRAPADDPETPYVAEVFGPGELGIARLAELMAKAESDELAELEDAIAGPGDEGEDEPLPLAARAPAAPKSKGKGKAKAGGEGESLRRQAQA